MCNLYSETKGQEAIRAFTRAMRDVTGNLPTYPDYRAPIVRNAPDGVRELTTARWGMPSPPKIIEGKKTDPGVTNVRNVSSPHWRAWLGVAIRALCGHVVVMNAGMKIAEGTAAEVLSDPKVTQVYLGEDDVAP